MCCSPGGSKELDTTECDRKTTTTNVLVIVNSTAMNIGEHVSFRITILSGVMTKNRIVGSYGNCIFSFFVALFSIVLIQI